MTKILDGIHKSFGKLKVIDDLTLDINPKEILCIVGPSGCGKSTLLNLIAGVIKPDKGKVNTANEKIGYIFQEDRLLPWETVYKNIAIVRKDKNHKEIKEIIENVGLKGFENSFPEELSGGMKQRCSIARGFYYKSTLLLMDEPFKSLDHDLRINMINYLIKLWQKSKNTIVFITHNIDEALLLGHQVMVLSKPPTKPIEVYSIDKPHKERNLTDSILTGLRNEIITQISRTNKED